MNDAPCTVRLPFVCEKVAAFSEGMVSFLHFIFNASCSTDVILTYTVENYTNDCA